MTDIWTRHDKAFAQVGAYAILDGADHVASIAFKYPRDGAGRLIVFLHVNGFPPVIGKASGYGYDKKSAAVGDAADKLSKQAASEGTVSRAQHLRRLAEILPDIDGRRWDDRLQAAGYAVLTVIE